MSDFNSYQKSARSTAIYPDEHKVIYPALGLANEAGEVLGKIKKLLRGDYDNHHESFDTMLRDELGDVLWYIAILADDRGISLQDIADANISKLMKRKSNNKIMGSGDNR